MCQKHCNALGTCTLRSHNANRAKKLGTAIAPPAVTRAPSLPAPFIAHLDKMADDAVFAPLRALDQYRQQESAHIAAEDRWLDAILAPLSEREEEADLALALRLSQESSTRSPSPPRLYLPSYSPLQRSPSPFFPTRLLSPTPSLSRASAPDVTGIAGPSVPRTRITAPSVQSKSKSRPLRITTQMTDDWMNDHGVPVASTQASSSSSQPSSTFHIKKNATRKPFVDQAVIERIIVVYWDLSGGPHAVHYVHYCPFWPTWYVSDARETLADLLHGTPLQLFVPRFREWTDIMESFPHSVTTDCVIMLRRHGVRGHEEAATIVKYYPPAAPSVHLHYNLPAERTAVRSEYKRRKASSSAIVIDCDPDSEVEFVDDVPAENNKRTIKEETQEEPPRQWPRLTAGDFGTTSTSPLIIIDNSPQSSPVRSPVRSVKKASGKKSAWPAGMYVVDMIHGFMCMESEDLKGLSREARFGRVFGEGRKHPYRSATYDDQKTVWKKALTLPALLCDKAKQAGR
ncbi:hypothetical protein C8R43DRAFT_1125001 [Mycena crocata]|nr:hypothetical protein C8R43DRAFT_1125001 [Mycena crocata]